MASSFATRAYYAREILAFVFAVGIALHSTAILIGREAFVEHVFTPAFDAAFTVPITYGAVAALLAWKRFLFRSPAHRAAFRLLTGYMLLSVLIHVRTLATWSTDYVLSFPPWYSFAIVPVQLAFLAIMLRVRIKRAASESDGDASSPRRAHG